MKELDKCMLGNVSQVNHSWRCIEKKPLTTIMTVVTCHLYGSLLFIANFEAQMGSTVSAKLCICAWS